LGIKFRKNVDARFYGLARESLARVKIYKLSYRLAVLEYVYVLTSNSAGSCGWTILQF